MTPDQQSKPPGAGSVEAWMRAGKHLPAPLRDFHAQKDLFKAIHELQQPDPSVSVRSPAFDVSWLAGHCYVVDRFLWFMARRGFTLQRSRTRLPFRDLEADVAHATKARNSRALPLFTSVSSEPGTPATASEPTSSAWRPLVSVPRDGRPVLLKPRKGGELHHPFVGRYVAASRDWSFAAPVGFGGIAEDMLEGWQPVPEDDTPASE